MRTIAWGAVVLLVAAPAVVEAFDRFVNPSATCGAGIVGGRPQHVTIQEAVDASSPGDAIGVCPGTYTEFVIVPAPKSGISLTGLGVVVVMSLDFSPAIDILADDVTVEGFDVRADNRNAILVTANGVTLQNNTLVAAASAVGLTGDRNRVLNNEIMGMPTGLFFRGNRLEVAGNRVSGELAGISANGLDLLSPGTQIHHNVVSAVFGASIRIRNAGGATIRNNLLSYSELGIDADATTGLTTSHNLVHHTDVGISVANSSDATVQNNTLRNNRGGIRAAGTTGLTIAHNLVERSRFGISVEDSGDATVRHNTVRGNDAGIVADGTTAVTILKNLVQRNGSGIVVQRSTDCLVVLNRVAFHTEHGIELGAIDGCTVERNNVSRSAPLDCSSSGSGSNTFARNSCATETPLGAWD